MDPAEHRGRLQVQGNDMPRELSFPWTRAEPISKAEARNELMQLQTQCTSSQRDRRDRAFRKAEAFVCAGPVDPTLAPIIRTFKNRNLPLKYNDAQFPLQFHTSCICDAITPGCPGS